MRERFLKHPVLKLISVVIAFLVWLAIMNISNPIITRTFASIPVNVTNGSYIESMNLSYALASGFDTVNVTVEATRSVVEKLTANSISANVDLTQIVDITANPVMVPVIVSVPGVNQSGVTVVPRNVQLRLEEMDSKEFVINAVAGSTTPARGYEVGSLTSVPEKLAIRGPRSMIDRIDKVQAEVDVSYLDSDATLDATLHVFDKNGDELSESRMQYLTFSLDEDSVKVYVQLYKVVPDVPIYAKTYGEPGVGYQVGEIAVTPQTISIAGSDEALESFYSTGGILLITEESKAVDISGATEDVEIKVNLPDYLPAGIRLATGFSETVVVTVKILEYNTKSLEFETKNIEKQGLAEGRNAVFESSMVDIRVKGSDSALESLTADQVEAYVDLKEAPLGTSTIPVRVVLPEGFSLAEDVVAEITVTENTVLSQTENPEGGV